MINYMRFFLVLIGLMLPFCASAVDEGSSSHVKVEFIQEEEAIQPGRAFWIALHLNLEKDWHVYWKNPGDAGIPLKVEWSLPPGFEAGPLQWPFPEKFTVADMVGFGYEGEVTLLSLITPPTQLGAGETLSLQAKIDWLVCSSLTCEPGSGSAVLPLKVTQVPPMPRADVAGLFEQARAKIPQTHIEVKTIRKDGIVQLEVPQGAPSPHGETIRGAYFFPEQKDIIDHTIDPTVAPSASHANRYLVNLKGSDEIGAKSQMLKGVLVLHKQKGAQESFQAFDIDSPIEEEDQEVLSLLDRVGKVLSFSPSIGEEGAVVSSSASSSASSFVFEGGLGLALVFAFVGGMILNLMPCVLPVMSFKVMSFVKMAGQSRLLTLKHALVFSFGVILSFWILASIMLILRAYGQAVGWGFQLQEPLFVVILASILFVLALSLFGVFEIGMFFSSWAGEAQVEAVQKSSGYASSFLGGILATAVATPCTGPFLGSAVGFAFTLPILQALTIFTVLGLGMCFPYLVLAGFPSFLRFMPKPGAWMETFKQLMGFVLLATVLWLLWVFSAQTDAFSLVCLLAGFLFFAIGCWIYGRGSSPLVNRHKRKLAYVVVALFATVGWWAILLPRESWYMQDQLSGQAKEQWKGWEDFSPERLAELRSQGKPVLIDFTAKWCLICQANHFVLDSHEVDKKLTEAGVVKLKADWTKNDPIITQELSKFGRNSVPLYVLYGPDEHQEPTILPQILTADTVIDRLKAAFSSGKNGVALK